MKRRPSRRPSDLRCSHCGKPIETEYLQPMTTASTYYHPPCYAWLTTWRRENT